MNDLPVQIRDQRYNLLKVAVDLECNRLNSDSSTEDEKYKADQIKQALHRIYLAIQYQKYRDQPTFYFSDTIKKKFRLINTCTIIDYKLETIKNMMHLRVGIKKNLISPSIEQPSLYDALNYSRRNPFNYIPGAMNGPIWGKSTSLQNVEAQLNALAPQALE